MTSDAWLCTGLGPSRRGPWMIDAEREALLEEMDTMRVLGQADWHDEALESVRLQYLGEMAGALQLTEKFMLDRDSNEDLGAFLHEFIARIKAAREAFLRSADEADVKHGPDLERQFREWAKEYEEPDEEVIPREEPPEERSRREQEEAEDREAGS